MFFHSNKENEELNEQKIVDTLRALSIDMIHEANSGHPGIALGAAPILYTLYAKHMMIYPDDPNWINRDRFILSAGHGSSLLYATLYMAGYDITLEDLKQFRNIHSKTPGHPEYKVTPGVEMTTGPLGEGLASSVGFAIAETILKSYMKKKNHDIIDYYTYVLCSDGDLMEGVSYEALSLAGTLELNKLIVFYDSNKICLDGDTSTSFTVDTEKYFASLNWNVLTANGENLTELDQTIKRAKQSSKPTIIIVNTSIGKYSKWEGTNHVHGTPLEIDDITNLKSKFGVRDLPFMISSDTQVAMRNMIHTRCDSVYEKFQKKYDGLDEDTKIEFQKIIDGDLSLENTKVEYELSAEPSENLRIVSSKVLNSLTRLNPLFLGGSADLSSSTMTRLSLEDDYSKENRLGKNINYGVREHAMGAIQNGITLSGIRNFSSTYLAFSDFLKPSLRLACQMNLANLYIFTHDSISVGKDGPTHQAMEQLIMLRSLPNLEVFRPNDANEMIGIYKLIASKKSGPSAVILGRNHTKIKTITSIKEVTRGGYIVLKEEKNISAIIIASGEELDLALEVSEILIKEGFDIRVVSMPSIERFHKQPSSYQEEILPFGTKVFVIEASSSYSWYSFVYNKKYLITQDEFGLSGDKEDVLNEFGFTKEKIVERIKSLLN